MKGWVSKTDLRNIKSNKPKPTKEIKSRDPVQSCIGLPALRGQCFFLSLSHSPAYALSLCVINK